MTFTLYHGVPTPEKIGKCRDSCGSINHGACWTPERITAHEWPYIADNGAWKAHVNDEEWNYEEWLSFLQRVEVMPREPDFVVLPDVVGHAEETYQRSATFRPYVTRRGWTPYFAVQDGMGVEDAVRYALKLECEGIFIGGSDAFKHKYTDQFIMTAHDYGLKCHVARPDVENLRAVIELGADSADTTSIVRNQNYKHLRTLENTLQSGTEQARLDL